MQTSLGSQVKTLVKKDAVVPSAWGRAMSAWPDPNLAGKFKLERQKRGAAKEVKLVDADNDLAGIPKSREQKPRQNSPHHLQKQDPIQGQR